jgi:transcription elongation factor GreA
MPDRTVYLTQEGFKRLDGELEHLRTVKRPEVSDRIRRSKDMNDVTDNAEYDEAKSEQSFIEGRIVELELTLANAQIIQDSGSTEYVGLGSRVKVRDDEGDEDDYRIVGSMEADAKHGMISNESPVGRALLGKKPGESATVVAPGGSFTLTVVTIG